MAILKAMREGLTNSGSNIEATVCKVHAAAMVQLVHILEAHFRSDLGSRGGAHDGLVLGQNL